MNAAKAASRMRARTAVSDGDTLGIVHSLLTNGTRWYHTCATCWYQWVPHRQDNHALGFEMRSIAEILTKGEAHAVTTLLFREHRVQLHRVGDRHRTIHLAATPPATTV